MGGILSNLILILTCTCLKLMYIYKYHYIPCKQLLLSVCEQNVVK